MPRWVCCFLKTLLFSWLVESLFLFSFPRQAWPAAPFSQVETLRDALGDPFPLGTPPGRIISLAPNLTEILFALGLGQKIVGVTKFCNFPAEAREITQVGGIIDPSLEKMVSLRPDLILAFRGTPLPVLAKMKSSRLPLFVLDEGEKVADLFPLILTIGIVTRSEKQSHELILTLKSRLKRVEDKIASASYRPRVLLLLFGPGFWTCGAQSFLSDLIEKAGGENIARSAKSRWVSLSREELLSLSPEAIVFLAPSPEEFLALKSRFSQDSLFKKIPAVAQDRFGFLTEDEASRFSPRLILALENLARFLHPALFPEL